MPDKKKSIPVNTMEDRFGTGVALGRVSIQELQSFGDSDQSHRDEYHIFFLLEEGTVSLEIDFQPHEIKRRSVVYIHPNQVHRIRKFKKVSALFLAINNENLNHEYLALLTDIAPAKPLQLDKEVFSLLSGALSISLRFSERKQEKMYHSLVRDSCNALVALLLSQYLMNSASEDKASRYDIITKAFKSLLERNFITIKSPLAYAMQLNISSAYLNECVKHVTGHNVSNHIHQRIILEAKRLLYHTNKSVKEIARELGYEDYAYFSRLFSKTTGISALSFRKKNHE